jgi:hypothetical protein
MKPSAALEERRFQDGEAASRAQLPGVALHAERHVERMALVDTSPNMGTPAWFVRGHPRLGLRGRGGVLKPKSTWWPDEGLRIYGRYLITEGLERRRIKSEPLNQHGRALGRSHGRHDAAADAGSTGARVGSAPEPQIPARPVSCRTAKLDPISEMQHVLRLTVLRRRSRPITEPPPFVTHKR